MVVSAGLLFAVNLEPQQPVRCLPEQTPQKIWLPLKVFISQPSLNNSDSSEPTVAITNVTGEDDRTQLPYSLSLEVGLQNTGDRTVYDAFSHVVAYNDEGLAIDTDYSWGGIPGNVPYGVLCICGFNYTGDPITNCTISLSYDVPISGTTA
jgi:hypothetical protein